MRPGNRFAQVAGNESGRPVRVTAVGGQPSTLPKLRSMLRRFAVALLIPLAAAASGVPAFAQSSDPPLTAQFENVPFTHDGSDSFEVELRFSENVILNARAFRNGLLTIDGGTQVAHSRLESNSNIAWRIEVTPSGDGDVVITLPASGAACDPDAAPCTSDGQQLSASVSVTVGGPASPLRARFENVPVSHDGSDSFMVDLRFSENVHLSADAFVNGLLTITGGTRATQSRLVPNSNIAWRIEVTPSGNDDVVITLPVIETCGSSVAPCTLTEPPRPLSASVSATVRSPAPRVTGPMVFAVAENQTAVATLTATDADTPAADLTWKIPAGAAGGADRGHFTLTPSGVLTFASAKDFEVPDDANRDGSYQLTVEVSNSSALTGTATLMVTLEDVNEAPMADAGQNQFAVEAGATVTLDGSGSSDQDDGDTENLIYLWTQAQTDEPAVTLTNSDKATATFTAPSGLTEPTTLTFTLQVTDAADLHDADTVSVTIGGEAREPPVITPPTGFTVAENTTAVATLTATDADTPEAGLEWSIPAGDADGPDGGKFELTSSGVLTFASAKDFEAPDDADGNGRYQVTVRVSDSAGDDGLEATANLTVTLEDVNEEPTADAGDDQTGIAPGATVTLDGSGSSDQDDGDTENLIYRWTQQAQTGVPAVTLTNAATATATFTAPSDLAESTAFTFTLRVTDPDGLIHEDSVTVTVTIRPPLTARFENVPLKHEGSGTIMVDIRFSENVHLSADAFVNGLLMIDGGTRTAHRRLESNSNVAWRIDVTPAGNDDVVITLPANGACSASVAPCTPDGRRLSASVSVTVSGPQRGPEPRLTGPTGFTVAENTTAVATLTATDADTPVAELTWKIPAGAAGGADRGHFTLTPSGVLAFRSEKNFESPDDANEDGRYQLTVEVSDGALTGTATLTVTLEDVNDAPMADAGQNQFAVEAGATVTLDGSGSSDQDDGDTENLIYLWTQAQTDEPAVTLTNSDKATATFTAPSGLTEPTTLTFTLQVTDAADLHDADTVSVTIGGEAREPPVITPPTGFTVAENTTAVATLTATDADTPEAGLEWSIPAGDADGPDGGKFELTSSGVLTFASAKDFEAPDDADGNGRYQVTVRVSDSAGDDGLEATANLTVTLEDVNEEPTADAGDDQTGIAPGATVTLDGSGSSDQDDGDTENLIYRWTQQAQTGVPAVTLTNAATATATFTAPSDLAESTAFTFTLRVTDADELFQEDSVTVTVKPALTARFENAEASYHGTTVFSVDLHFSEEVDLNARAFVNGLLTITGGTRTHHQRVTPRNDIAWRIDVTPSGTADVVITLPAGRACDPDFAPCTPDGRRLSAAASVTVTLRLGPVFSGSGSFTAAENQTAVATLTATDADTPVAELTWKIPEGDAGGADGGKFALTPSGVLTFASAKNFEDPDDDDGNGRYQVTVEVSDGDQASTANLEVTLDDVNEAPTAVAGDDQSGVAAGATVTLDGSQSSDPDADDTLLRYAWTQAQGPAVTLSNANDDTATFTVPVGLNVPGIFQFTLAVTDAAGLSHEDTMTVVAGPTITGSTSFSAAENQTAVATLMATKADPQSDTLAWKIPSGAAGGADGGDFTLSTAGVLAFASEKDYESPDDAGGDRGYEVTVEVSDGSFTSTADLTVTLTDVNEAPIADAGPNVFGATPGESVTLIGSGSDPELSDVASYTWTQTGGTDVALTGADSQSATFTVPSNASEGATFTFTLEVTDRIGLTHEDTVTVTVGGQAPAAPVINSPVRFMVMENQKAVATLTATDTDTPATELTWSIPAGDAGGADRSRFTLSTSGVLEFASAQDFEGPDDANTDGSYQVTVRVSDNSREATANLTVTLIAPGKAW